MIKRTPVEGHQDFVLGLGADDPSPADPAELHAPGPVGHVRIVEPGEAQPDPALLLGVVDVVDDGVHHAVDAGRRLLAAGGEPVQRTDLAARHPHPGGVAVEVIEHMPGGADRVLAVERRPRILERDHHARHQAGLPAYLDLHLGERGSDVGRERTGGPVRFRLGGVRRAGLRPGGLAELTRDLLGAHPDVEIGAGQRGRRP
jgi:hypothetical protein